MYCRPISMVPTRMNLKFICQYRSETDFIICGYLETFWIIDIKIDISLTPVFFVDRREGGGKHCFIENEFLMKCCNLVEVRCNFWNGGVSLVNFVYFGDISQRILNPSTVNEQGATCLNDEVDDKFIDALNEETIAECVASVDGGARDLFCACVAQEQYPEIRPNSYSYFQWPPRCLRLGRSKCGID